MVNLSLGASDLVTEFLDGDIDDYLDYNRKYLVELEPVYRIGLFGRRVLSHVRLFAKEVKED